MLQARLKLSQSQQRLACYFHDKLVSAVSFGRNTIQTFHTLDRDQQTKFLSFAFFSVVLAIIEILSIAVLVPLFNTIIVNQNGNGLNDRLLSFFTGAERTSVSTIVWLTIFIFTGKNLLSIFLTNTQGKFANNIYASLVLKSHQKFFSQSWTEYVKENSAEAFKKIKTVPYDFTHHVLLNYLNIITDFSICVLMTTVLLWLDFRILIVITMIGIPLLIIQSVIRKKFMSKVDHSFRTLTPKGNILLAQSIDSYAETKIYQKEKYFTTRFNKIIKVTNRQLIDLKSFASLPSRLIETLVILVIGIILLTNYNRNSTIHNELYILAGLTLLALYKIIPSINKFMSSYTQIQAHAYSITAVNDIVKMNEVQTEPYPFLNFKHSINLKNISFRYNESTADLIKSSNLEIKKGEFILVEGISGAGKTTLLNLLAGLMHVTQGNIFIDEEILSEQNIKQWQDRVGIVPQANVVLNDRIAKNIAFAEDDDQVDSEKLEQLAHLVGLKTFIDSLPQKFDTLLGENGITISGGQRQRLVLARALYRNPEVLLLDEVTNQLDEQSKLTILRLLRQLSEQGRTIIIASHDPAVKAFASKIIELVGGELKEFVHFSKALAG